MRAIDYYKDGQFLRREEHETTTQAKEAAHTIAPSGQPARDADVFAVRKLFSNGSVGEIVGIYRGGGSNAGANKGFDKVRPSEDPEEQLKTICHQSRDAAQKRKWRARQRQGEQARAETEFLIEFAEFYESQTGEHILADQIDAFVAQRNGLAVEKV